MVAISMFSGIIVMTMYAAQLFIDSGAIFDANLSAIILGILQVCGTYASSMLVDRVGRRMLLGISSLGAAISLFVFGTFSYLNKQGFDLSAVDWIPVVRFDFRFSRKKFDFLLMFSCLAHHFTFSLIVPVLNRCLSSMSLKFCRIM